MYSLKIRQRFFEKMHSSEIVKSRDFSKILIDFVGFKFEKKNVTEHMS